MKNRNLDHKDDWATPKSFYDELWNKYRFDFDPCPFQHDMSWDGLQVEWGRRNFVNPPYSDKKETGHLKSSFVKKGIEEAKKGKMSVFLLPVSTSTQLFHNYIKPNAKEIIFLKGRLNFKGINQRGQYVNWGIISDEKIIFEDKEYLKYIKNGGQHDSMLVIF